MKIKNGLKLREVGGVNIVVAVGDMAARFKGVVRLNATGAFLWKKLEEGADEAALTQALTEKYEVDEATARADAIAFLDMARKADFIDE